MKPKVNRKADPTQSLTMDRCESPAYSLDPLLPYLKPFYRIWEPACGTGRIVRVLEAEGYQVAASDILDGTNFLTPGSEPPFHWQAVVTNPPYSLKPQFIRRCYDLGKPFALLVPVETIGTGAVQRMMETYGCELLLLDKRVNFYMPNKGNAGSAQFPVLWFCWHLLPAPIVYGRITRRQDEQLSLLEVA